MSRHLHNVRVTASQSGATQATVPILGRDAELDRLHRFFDVSSASHCLVLSGVPGIGKTALWEAGLTFAATHGYLVLSARTSQAEISLSFAALADLLDGVHPDVLTRLPAPQLNALEVALRIAAPTGAGPDRFAISAGFLFALRASAEREPLLVAVDDVQWLDPSSADSLAFAARRLSNSRVRFLITRRPHWQSDLERLIQPAYVERLEVAQLSLGATGRILSDRLGLALPHRVIRRVHRTSHGNPLYALELGRLLVAHGVPDIGSELPIPDLVEDLFGARVRELPEPSRRALLAVALSAGMSRSELSTLVNPQAVEDVITSGLLTVDRSHVRPAHPMLAAAAMRLSTSQERRALHRELASAVNDATLSARHLAKATAAADSEVAKIVARAAELAAMRGAAQDAEELGAHALRLTPAQDPERTERLLALGRFHLHADEMARVTDLLSAGMADLPPGRPRAIAHLLLGNAADFAEDTAHAEHALAEGGNDPEVRALALAKRSRLMTASAAERIDEAEASAVEALAAAKQVGGAAESNARQALAWARILRGRPIDDLIPSESRTDIPSISPDDSIDRCLGAQLTFRGQVREARTKFRQLIAQGGERGDLQAVRLVQQQLCELELRAGDVRAAAALLEELDPGPGWMGKVRARLRAVLAAVTGLPAEATSRASEVLDVASGYPQGWDRLEAIRAVGLAAVFERDATRAVENFRMVWEHSLREHVDDPGAFPVAGDLVEALVQSGDIESAKAVTERLRRSAVSLKHPWGLATAKRCAAVVQMADRYTDEATTRLDEAAGEYAAIGLNFERARTLLLLGSIQRRFKKRGAARRSLEQAAEEFATAGCSGWAALARSELARVSGRRSGSDDQLTPSERRVVELAASGLSNKEIAGQLFVSVYTVEEHLKHAYTKLGVRSRAQLASRYRGSAQ